MQTDRESKHVEENEFYDPYDLFEEIHTEEDDFNIIFNRDYPVIESPIHLILFYGIRESLYREPSLLFEE